MTGRRPPHIRRTKHDAGWQPSRISAHSISARRTVDASVGVFASYLTAIAKTSSSETGRVPLMHAALGQIAPGSVGTVLSSPSLLATGSVPAVPHAPTKSAIQPIAIDFMHKPSRWDAEEASTSASVPSHPLGV